MQISAVYTVNTIDIDSVDKWWGIIITTKSFKQVQEELAIRKILLRRLWKPWSCPLWCASSGRTNNLQMIRENMVRNSSHFPWWEYPFKTQQFPELWDTWNSTKAGMNNKAWAVFLGKSWGQTMKITSDAS